MYYPKSHQGFLSRFLKHPDISQSSVNNAKSIVFKLLKSEFGSNNGIIVTADRPFGSNNLMNITRPAPIRVYFGKILDMCLHHVSEE